LSDVSEDDSDENGERPKKKKREKKRSAPKLPEWTRQSSTEIVRKRSVGRSSTKERWKGDAM